jgi:uncharacterized protein (DUF362 family)
MEKVYKEKVTDNLKETIVEVVKSLGGFEKLIDEGDVVFLKPNFNTADPFPASTDLEFLKVVTELIYKAGAKMVMIGESSTMSMNTRKIMEEIGVFELQEMKKPPRIYVFEEEKWEKVSIPKAKYLRNVTIPTIQKRADKLIYLPCLKTHMYAQLTGALKLSVGFMKPFERLALHMRNIQEKIAELNTLFQPDLVIMDARKCFINRGPSEGELKNPNLILASKSRVAIDIEGVKIIQSYPGNSLKGIDANNLPQIDKAVELKVK